MDKKLEEKGRAFAEAMKKDPEFKSDLAKLNNHVIQMNVKNYQADGDPMVTYIAKDFAKYAETLGFEFTLEEAEACVEYYIEAQALKTKVPQKYFDFLEKAKATESFSEDVKKARLYMNKKQMKEIQESGYGEKINAAIVADFIRYASSKGFDFTEEEAVELFQAQVGQLQEKYEK